MTRPLTVAVYSLELGHYACARLRFLDPARALRGRLRLVWGARSDGKNYALDPAAMDGADVVAFQRCFPMPETWPLVERALASGKPVIYDVDDHFAAMPPGHPMAGYMDKVVPFCRELAGRARAVRVTTPELARAYAQVSGRVEIVPNLVDEAIFSAPPRGAADPGRPVRIVYAGSPTHTADLDLVVPALRRVLDRFGDGVEVFFFGCLPGVPDLAGRARRLDFSDDYTAYARTLTDLAPDIGLAPLRDTPFNRAKSNIKALEYAACGVAGIYADLPPYRDPRTGECPFGLLAGQDPGAWEQALVTLVADVALRRRLAAKARSRAIADFGLSRHADIHLRFYQALRGGDEGTGRDDPGPGA